MRAWHEETRNSISNRAVTEPYIENYFWFFFLLSFLFED